jgi:pSer/pThr/pTyr-binding forkhead associated (FHA) protein
MLVANRSALAARIDMSSVHQPDVVLKPLSRPELGEIHIDDALFAIGRTEPPFASYGNGVVNMLSRRHACIFRKEDGVYLADLESRNGTSVNHVGVGRAPCQLRDGDEICFADTLSYRVQITSHIRPEGSLTLTLTPEPTDSGLDPIVLTKLPFLVSKTEATFSRYRSKSEHGRQLGYLSRRQAYIYQKGEQAYIEDLGSGNGTFIDGVRLEHAVPLQDGALVAFGGKHFAYRVSIAREPGVEQAHTDAHKPVLTLVRPLEPADSDVPEPVSLAELVRLHDPVSQPEPARVHDPVSQSEPARVHDPVTQPALALDRGPDAPQATASEPPQPAVEPPPNDRPAPAPEFKPNLAQAPVSGKTQFMAAPTSFLDIFCDANEPKPEAVQGGSAVPSAAAAKEPVVSRRPRGRALLLLSELASLHASSEPEGARRSWWRVAAIVGILGALVVGAYLWNAPERDLKNAFARGEYARAAALATRLLDNHPDDVDLKALATDATLKANVPTWLAKVRARDFDGAKGVLAGMSELGRRDAHLRPMIDELGWLGTLEHLISGRGGPEAPIRIYADEDSIEHLIGSWNDETGEHQRALARIASHVPQFGDFYGEALTHLRKLQSESTVYLPVIERVKAKIATELERDNPDALKPLLKETADKYPGLGGLDSVRQDLTGYIEIRREARARKSGRLFALLRQAHFVTPPFKHGLQALVQSGQLPSAALLQQYDAATQAWKDGHTSEALAGLQKMASGSWGEDATKELERRGSVAARFTELQQSRNAGDFVDRLLAFRGSLDADEDVYFVHATAADLNQQKDNVIARAQDAMNRARTLWEEYRNSGAIDASQRIETSISDQFRTCAHLLAEASKSVQQGFLIYSEVDPAGATQWTAIRDEIEAEIRQQRDKLNDLANVVEPELLKTKLALLGDASE